MRGWTRGERGRRQGARGAPAHAGMDPVARRRSGDGLGCPRTCGDGPMLWAEHVRPLTVPPHMRGWTLRVLWRRRSDGGAPAHAGMDPTWSCSNLRHPWCPRTCGDGPLIPTILDGGQKVPPHMRGWTSSIGGPRHGCGGAPAHAGMDPSASWGSRRARRCPRTCGDGPYGDQWLHGLRQVPPHMRGWTRHAGERHRQPDGAPAHAGMDPLIQSYREGADGCPRTCGDGPAALSVDRASASVPPHMRGWTLGGGRREDHGAGAPAHAGMDPKPWRKRASRTWCPRTCGDGPRAPGTGRTSPLVPPHMRGWTFATGSGRADKPGAPAHAGMDPC